MMTNEAFQDLARRRLRVTSAIAEQSERYARRLRPGTGVPSGPDDDLTLDLDRDAEREARHPDGAARMCADVGADLGAADSV